MKDVADLVQRLRHVLWLTPKTGEFYRVVLVDLLIDLDWRKPDSLRDLAQALIDGQEQIEADDFADALRCATELEQLAVAFEADPPMPSVDDLIARYVGAEIGDRTVLWVMDWEHGQLFDACDERGLPTIQMTPTASPGALEALAETLRKPQEDDQGNSNDEQEN